MKNRTESFHARDEIGDHTTRARDRAASDSRECPGCGARHSRIFYDISAVPVHSVLLFSTREEALSYPRGNMVLALCLACGFIWNMAYTGEHIEYSDRYEETQGYSAAFQDFHHQLAERLIERFDLRKKTVLEIGCGKRGEFLHLLCDLGDNRGLGFDPVYSPERDPLSDRSNTRFFREFYSEAHQSTRPDFVCCKMTLEHVAEPYAFVRMVRAAVGEGSHPVIFFQVPEMRSILERNAFWDVYYEHCSYFGESPLVHLFERAGFRVLDTWNEYDDQLLMIAATPRDETATIGGPRPKEVSDLVRLVSVFEREVEGNLERWKAAMSNWMAENKRMVIWGAGSKGVAFLTKIGISDAVEYAVDINPKKWDTFMAGTGQRIIAPGLLRSYGPDVVIVMNPYYIPEIGRELRAIGIAPAVFSIERPEESATLEYGGTV